MHVQCVCSEFPILFQDFALQQLQATLFRLKQMKTQKGEKVNISVIPYNTIMTFSTLPHYLSKGLCILLSFLPSH